MKFIFYLLLLLLILLIIKNKKENFINYSFYTKNYNKTSLSKDIKSFNKNCLSICNDIKFCNEFNIMKKNYNKCIKCNKKGYCFKKMETNKTICEPCIKGVEYINNCNSVYNDACPLKNDIYNFNGTKPYFNLISDNNIYNPYNTKCVKCK
jgi:hypothetical protein